MPHDSNNPAVSCRVWSICRSPVASVFLPLGRQPVLRGLPRKVPYFYTVFEKMCLGNKYTTTLHCINSALHTLGALATVGKVYRGMAGGQLPESFIKEDEYGAKGGVEFGFMSTTTNREVAVHYARGEAALIFEIQLGLVDRGADLSWLSQYSHEKEICFPPLTALRVRELHIDGSVLIVELDPRFSDTEADREMEADLEAFVRHDKDKSGELDQREFGLLLNELRAEAGLEPFTAEEVSGFFVEANVSQLDGCLSYQEFMDWRKKRRARRAELEAEQQHAERLHIARKLQEAEHFMMNKEELEVEFKKLREATKKHKRVAIESRKAAIEAQDFAYTTAVLRANRSLVVHRDWDGLAGMADLPAHLLGMIHAGAFIALTLDFASSQFSCSCESSRTSWSTP